MDASLARIRQRRLEEAAERLEAAQSQQQCIICESALRDTMFMPCGHLLVCQGCAARPQLQERCPMCSGEIAQRVRVFFG